VIGGPSNPARRRWLQQLALLGAGAGAGAGLRLAHAGDEAPLLRFDELYAGMSPLGLQFSPRVQALRGQRVRLRGFAAPPLRADASFLVLTRQPMSVCPFCASDADWPADIVVVYCREPSLIPGGKALLAQGQLETGHHIDPATGFVSQLRLRGAELTRL
jgi:hypothetical protein